MTRWRGGRTGPLSVVSALHGVVADYMRPDSEVPKPDELDFASRFTTLLALAALFIPFFVYEFIATGNTPAAIALLITACVMIASACVYKWTGWQGAARDMFLGGLCIFLLWEASFFDTIYSPGTVWFGVLAVVAILLGSLRAGAGWIAVGLAGIAGTYLFTGDRDAFTLITSPGYELLFTVSVSGMIFATFLFVAIIDAGRSDAHARLVSANARNRRLAERDELTGLFNRRALSNLLEDLLVSQSRETAVIFMDLDGFKDVNDTYGHDIGDALLQEIAESLQAMSERAGATVARLGGDEFAVVVSGPDAAMKSDKIAQDMLEAVAAPFDLSGRRANVGVSMGLATSGPGIDATELMRQADVALYAAKNSGRMRICRYNRELDAVRTRRRKIAALLAKALQAGDLQVHYQPIVGSKSLAITGVEALARWTTTNGEVVQPDEFISIAEEAGVIDQLGLFVLERACRDWTGWPDITVAVNLSPVQFRSPTLIDDVVSILAKTGFEPCRLELEVTEGYLIEHRERAQPVIGKLRQQGIRVVLDDFGSGYSSIGYLRQYEFDRLKIDRSLVTNVAVDETARSIIQAVAILARSLSLSLTAEGVEDEETARLLRLAGCDRLQGYCFGRPQPRANLAPMINPKAGAANSTS